MLDAGGLFLEGALLLSTLGMLLPLELFNVFAALNLFATGETPGVLAGVPAWLFGTGVTGGLEGRSLGIGVIGFEDGVCDFGRANGTLAPLFRPTWGKSGFELCTRKCDKLRD